MNHQRSRLLLFTLLVLAAPFAQALDVDWMQRVVTKQRCLESLGLSVIGPECYGWTKKETATPVFDSEEGRVFVGGSDGVLHIVDPTLRRTVSQQPLNGSLMSAPLLVEDTLVFGTDRGILYKKKKSDGSTLFEIELDSGILQTPYRVKDHLYVVTQIGTLYAISIADGAILWTRKRDLPNRIFLRHLSTPTLIESMVNGSNRSLLALGNPSGKLAFFDTANGELVDEMSLSNPKEPFGDVATAPLLYGNLLYAASYNQSLVAVDAMSRVRRWEVKERGITQLAVKDGFLIAAGPKLVLGIDALSGKVLWRYTFRKGAPGPIAFDGANRVLVASDIDALYVLDLRSGKPLQVLGSGLGIVGQLQKMDDGWLAMSAGGTLFFLSHADRVVSGTPIAR